MEITACNQTIHKIFSILLIANGYIKLDNCKKITSQNHPVPLQCHPHHLGLQHRYVAISLQ